MTEGPCRRCRELLDVYLTGAIGESDACFVKSHVEQCGMCCRELAFARKLMGVVRSLHCDPGTLVDLAVDPDSVGDRERRRSLEHLESCSTCRDEFERLKMVARDAGVGGAAAPGLAGTARRWWFSGRRVWITGAGLAGAIAVALLVREGPALFRDGAPVEQARLDVVAQSAPTRNTDAASRAPLAVAPPDQGQAAEQQPGAGAPGPEAPGPGRSLPSQPAAVSPASEASEAPPSGLSQELPEQNGDNARTPGLVAREHLMGEEAKAARVFVVTGSWENTRAEGAPPAYEMAQAITLASPRDAAILIIPRAPNMSRASSLDLDLERAGEGGSGLHLRPNLPTGDGPFEVEIPRSVLQAGTYSLKFVPSGSSTAAIGGSATLRLEVSCEAAQR